MNVSTILITKELKRLKAENKRLKFNERNYTEYSEVLNGKVNVFNYKRTIKKLRGLIN